MSRGASMDAINLDEWELLPDNKSSFFVEAEGCNGGVGGKDQLLLGAELVVIDTDHFSLTSHPPPPYDCILDEEAKKPLLLPSEDAYGSDPDTDFKDIAVVPIELEREELVTEIVIYEAEDHGEVIKSPAAVKEIDQDEVLAAEAAAPAPDGQCAQEGEGISKTGFSVGNLRGNGVGALCSFGVAAATFCIFLLGGKQQPLQKRREDHKIQLQMYAGDERIQQASRLNQAMSSVIGGASSARASISFGGYYQGF